MPNATEDRFLGALLGLAIGDALGMPVEGWPAAKIAERLGRIEGYHRRVFPDGTAIEPGEFTDESEVVLCLVESMTANSGQLDPDNVGARLLFLARGESKRWMSEETRAALARADETLEFRVPLDEDGPATGEVAARGVPLGLLHAVGPFDPDRLRAETETAVRLTHGSPAAITAALAVAYGVRLAARGETPAAAWAGETAAFLGGGAVAAALAEVDRRQASGNPIAETLAVIGTGSPAAEAVPAAFAAAMAAPAFEDGVLTAVNAGGDTDTVAALAGALAGAANGASGIPQPLIDDLGGRIYVSLAAPWFFRTAQRRAGLVIDLHPSQAPPRPTQPPRF